MYIIQGMKRSWKEVNKTYKEILLSGEVKSYQVSKEELEKYLRKYTKK